jgi:predicted  nucleic acid-binding Zn-ribbon protein
MNNPLVHAFFLGRALAEALGEQLESAVTSSLSDLGKFDAEQRERLRQFTEMVMERARQSEEQAMQNRPVAAESGGSSGNPQREDLQTMIDDLRAEIAHLRTELQNYRSRSV